MDCGLSHKILKVLIVFYVIYIIYSYETSKGMEDRMSKKKHISL